MSQEPWSEKHPEIETVLVVGANGNVGRHLIPRLLEQGYRVRALEHRSKVPPRDGQEIVPGNTMDAGSLRRAVEGVQAVCHMIRGVGPGAIGQSPCERWFNVCVRGAVNLLEAARQAPLRRFVAGSADNVLGHSTIPHFGPLTETSPRRFADEYYGLFKIAEEEICRQYHLGFALPVVIARFGWIWTEEFIERGAFAMDRDRRKILRRLDVTGRPCVRHDVHIDDAVQAVLLSLRKDAAVGQDFNIAGPSAYSSDELARVLRDKFGYEIEDQRTDRQSWTTDTSKARSILGYRPHVNLLDWLREGLRRLP